MKTKLRLKKEVYYTIGIIILLIISIIFGINKFKEYKYHQTYEYKLIEHGYSEDNAKILIKEFDDLNYFLENKVDEKYILLTKEKYYLKKNFKDYISYMQENKKLSLSDIVRNINIHLNKKFYEVTYDADVSKDTSMIVNKYYVLKSDYNPDDLVTISQNYSWGDLGSQRVRKVAYDAFLDMWNAANNDGYYLMVNSSFRSYDSQKSVYDSYEKSRGKKYADSIAARPGSSEHQTGLAMDIFSKTNTNKNTFKDSETAKWLKENSYKYGFILRYPEDKVNITGYNYEAWHFRYVGIDIATTIYNENITFEEYYAYYIEK